LIFTTTKRSAVPLEWFCFLTPVALLVAPTVLLDAHAAPIAIALFLVVIVSVVVVVEQ
jgi:hypothetical protein